MTATTMGPCRFFPLAAHIPASITWSISSLDGISSVYARTLRRLLMALSTSFMASPLLVAYLGWLYPKRVRAVRTGTGPPASPRDA